MRCSAIKRAAALRELADLGCHKAKAAELMGVSRNLVSRICRDYSVDMPHGIDNPERKEARANLIRSMLRRGMSRVAVAQRLGLCRSRVSQMLVEYGIDLPPRQGRRRSHLTLRRVAALREMATLGTSQTGAAVLFSMEPASIGRICRVYGVKMPHHRSKAEARISRLILRDFGKPGITLSVMAERYQASRNSIDVTVHRLRKEGKLPPVQERC